MGKVYIKSILRQSFKLFFYLQYNIFLMQTKDQVFMLGRKNKKTKFTSDTTVRKCPKGKLKLVK